jgi:hypothetical protein
VRAQQPATRARDSRLLARGRASCQRIASVHLRSSSFEGDMTIEHRQRSESSLSNTSDRANRRGPPPPLSTNRSNLSALSPPTNTLLTPLSGTNPQYSLLSPGGAARSSSPRGRAHTVADPNAIQRQHSYVQHSAMSSFYVPPPPPPQQTSNPGSHIRLPGPPPRPATAQNHGQMQMQGYWNPPPGQYPQQMHQPGYNPSLYPQQQQQQHPAYPLPPPPMRPPQQQQQQLREPLTSATYVPDGASFGPGKNHEYLQPR